MSFFCFFMPPWCNLCNEKIAFYLAEPYVVVIYRAVIFYLSTSSMLELLTQNIFCSFFV